MASIPRTVTRPDIDEETRTDPRPEPRYHLILLDDNDHTYDYVIELLGRIFGYGREKAFALARIVDVQGRVIVETADLERVTQHQGQIHAYGPDHRVPRCQGSMSAIIEPAE